MTTTPDRLHEIAERLRRRGAGELGATDDCYAEEIGVQGCGDVVDFRTPSAARLARTGRSLETLPLALPDFRSEVVVHVDEQSGTLMEVTTWSGTTVRVAGSSTEGELMRFCFCTVYTVEDGVIARVKTYDDPATSRRWNELMTHTRLETARAHGG